MKYYIPQNDGLEMGLDEELETVLLKQYDAYQNHEVIVYVSVRDIDTVCSWMQELKAQAEAHTK